MTGGIFRYRPQWPNVFVTGAVTFVDRQPDVSVFSIQNNKLVFSQTCLTSVSGYARLAGVDSRTLVTRAKIKITQNGSTGAVGPWTAAEAKHGGISIFHSDPDNNYILMISPAASALGERSVQLIKQVSGVETILDTEILAGLSLNTDYICELYRSAGIVTGNVYSEQGVLLATVSASDTSLSTGVSGMHGYSCAYNITDPLIS